MIKKIFALMALAFLCNSCYGPHVIQETLCSYKFPIEYLHVSNPPKNEKKITLYSNGIINKSFSPETTVIEGIYSEEVDTIGLNKVMWTMYEVYLGQNSVRTPYIEFLFGSLERESERSGIFKYDRRLPKKDSYGLEMTIEECDVNSIYISTGSLIVANPAIDHRNMTAKAKSQLRITTKIKKNNSVEFEKEYIINKTQDNFHNGTNVAVDIEKNFMANMTDCLSYTTKSFIDSLTIDINKFFSK